MALIKCNECGQEISDKATACPKCGKPTGLVIKRKSPSIAFLGNFFFGGWAGYFYVGEYVLGVIFLITFIYDVYTTFLGRSHFELFDIFISLVLMFLLGYDAQEKAKKYNQAQLKQ
jgi:DNA-directed RNA polymerase subunit RPC12/RpoP